MVFSNYAPETDALSSDRWTIFNISADLQNLEKIPHYLAYQDLPPQNANGKPWQTQKKQSYYTPNSP